MNRFASLVAALLLVGLSSAAWAGDTYKVDPVHSSAVFRVGHANIGVVYGQFTESGGTFTLDSADPSKSSFDVELQAASVNTHVDKRDAHLKSPDFLNAKQYPVISFKSTQVKKVDDTHLEVTGDLSLHGVTRSITVPIEITGKGEFPPGKARAGIEAVFEVKQSDYQIKGLPGMTSDVVKLMVALEGTR